jgi:hypothetical protein
LVGVSADFADTGHFVHPEPLERKLDI